MPSLTAGAGAAMASGAAAAIPKRLRRVRFISPEVYTIGGAGFSLPIRAKLGLFPPRAFTSWQQHHRRPPDGEFLLRWIQHVHLAGVFPRLYLPERHGEAT